MKLFIYDHCPYCVKARMIFGLKGINFDLVTLLNDDEKTPISMIGQKMVPILEKDDGSYMAESMDIVNYIDSEYGESPIIKGPKNPKISEWLGETTEYLYRLAMPRWVKVDLEEFKTQAAIDYFTNKKERMIGSFEENLNESDELIAKANKHLEALSLLIISNNAVNGDLSEDDIHLFTSLRSLSVVKGINYPKNVMEYMKEMSERTNIPLHLDIAL